MDKKFLPENRPESGSEETRNKEKLEKLGWGKATDPYRMDADKLMWHKDRLTEWVSGKRIAPLHIDMGITTGCNLGCKFCYGVVQARKGFVGTDGWISTAKSDGNIENMPLETIIRIFDDAKRAGVRSVNIDGSGENTLNPALKQALEHAVKIDLDVALATHGASIKYDTIDTLLTSLQWLRINLSAATRESYKVVHQRDWFDKVIKNTKLLVEGKKKRGLKNNKGLETTIGFQMILTRDNFDDIVTIAKLGQELGIDYTVIKPISDTPDNRLDAPFEEYLNYVDVFKEAESYSTDEYSVIIKWKKMGNMGNKRYEKCYGTRFIIAIEGDGSVFPCGHWFDIERENFLLGNVNETSLYDIFKSKKYWKIQNEILNVDLRYCQANCRQHNANLSLWDIMQKKNPIEYIESVKIPDVGPKHINFV
jgi:radical SAM protein with 4Fe4S-binding SPASM domain